MEGVGGGLYCRIFGLQRTYAKGRRWMMMGMHVKYNIKIEKFEGQQ